MMCLGLVLIWRVETQLITEEDTIAGGGSYLNHTHKVRFVAVSGLKPVTSQHTWGIHCSHHLIKPQK